METYSWKKEHLGPILKKNRSFGNLFLKKKDHLGTYSRKIDHLGIFLRTGRSFGNLFLNKKHLQTYSWKKRAFRSNSYIIGKLILEKKIIWELILEQKSIWGLIPGKGG